MPFNISFPVRTPGYGSMYISPMPHYISRMPVLSPQVSYDKIQSEIDNSIDRDLQSMADNAAKISNYNIMTSVMQTVETINQQAVLNKWNISQYEDKINSYVSNLKIDDPELASEINRYIELNKVDIKGKLLKIQMQDHINEALANLQTTQKVLAKSLIPNDIDSIKMATIKWKIAVEKAKDNGIINPVYANNLLDRGTKELLNDYFTATVQNEPEKFLQDLKSGVYDDIIQNPSQKSNLIKTAKNIIRHNQLIKRQQEELNNANLIYQLLTDIQEGKLTISSVKDLNIPDEVKYKVLSIGSRIEQGSLTSAKIFTSIESKIINNEYQSLADLQKDLDKYGDYIDHNKYIQLSNMFLRHKAIGSNVSEPLKSSVKNFYSSIPSMVSDRINMLKNNLQSYLTLHNEQFNINIPETEIVNNARVIWLDMYDKLCKNGCSYEMLNHITNAATVKAMLPIKKDVALNYNMDVWKQLDGWKDKYGINIDEGMANNIIESFISNVLLNDKINNYKDIRLNDFMSHHALNSFQFNVVLRKKGSKSSVNDIKLPVIITYDGSDVYIKPEDVRMWKDVFGNYDKQKVDIKFW